MARKRIFLDECNSDLRSVFGSKDHVYTAKDFGMTGKEDPKAIDAAVQKKCSIVTVNKDFLASWITIGIIRCERGSGASTGTASSS
jgi:predicted nuclease of predicted toxin-antitoxin system